MGKTIWIIGMILGILLLGAMNGYTVISSDAKISTLNNENAQLVADNSKLQITSNLKSFENAKALERFLKESKSPDLYKDDYPSVACVNLMKEAKEKGYFLGITAINTTNESVYSAMIRDKISPQNDVKWGICNVAIVGDGDIYLVGSQSRTSYFVVSMQGDFTEYYNTKPNVSNLQLH